MMPHRVFVEAAHAWALPHLRLCSEYALTWAFPVAARANLSVTTRAASCRGALPTTRKAGPEGRGRWYWRYAVQAVTGQFGELGMGRTSTWA